MKKLLSLLLLITLLLCSCGGDDPVPITETRGVEVAREGIDYDIDYVKVSIIDAASGNGAVTHMTYDEFCDELSERKKLGQDIEFRVTVKFTSRVELHSAEISTKISFWSEQKSETKDYLHHLGNREFDEAQTVKNIRPGAHYLHFDGKIEKPTEDQPSYVLNTINYFDSIDELKFSFKRYV